MIVTIDGSWWIYDSNIHVTILIIKSLLDSILLPLNALLNHTIDDHSWLIPPWSPDLRHLEIFHRFFPGFSHSSNHCLRRSRHQPLRQRQRGFGGRSEQLCAWLGWNRNRPWFLVGRETEKLRMKHGDYVCLCVRFQF